MDNVATTVHEFVRNTSKWLKIVATNKEVCVTHRGEVRYKVIPVATKPVVNVPGVVLASQLNYSCGCKRGLIKTCNKHGVE